MTFIFAAIDSPVKRISMDDVAGRCPDARNNLFSALASFLE
jgi:hypothetical protein